MKDSFQLVISDADGGHTSSELPAGVYTLGSDESNRIVLSGEAIAWRHAILGLTPDGCWVEDLASPAGVRMGEKRISGREAWAVGSVLRIGPFELALAIPGQPPREQKPAAEPAPVPEPPANPSPPAPEPAPPSPPPSSPRPEASSLQREIKRQVHEELLRRLDLKRLTAGRIDEKDLRVKARQVIGEIIADIRDRLPAGFDGGRLTQDVYDEALGLGPLEDLLADPEVTEIMVNGADRVYVEKDGRLSLSGRTFLNDESVGAIIERIVAPIGRRVDESQPFVDARLNDGSRVNVIIPPLSLSGPCITVRKFSAVPMTVDDLIRFGTFPPRLAPFLRAAVLLRRNIVVSGGTGSGKTTLLNVISSYLPRDERIVTIEDAAELRLTQDHIIRLEARPPNIEGRGAITIRDLVRNALRMRPDRIVVGECRGGEALDMLQAMNTGHEGSLTTVHANSPRDVISRLETMVLMSGMDLPLRAIREQIGAAIHLVVHTARMADGSRKIERITEVVGLEGEQITMQDLFSFTQTGLDENGRVQGRLLPTGSVPAFIELAAARGVLLEHALFDPDSWTP